MAISGKPMKTTPSLPPAPQADEETVRKLINRGGSIAEATRQESPATIKPMLVQLRLYPDLVREIDAARDTTASKRRRAPSRHAWILRAIEEKLEREGKA